MSLCGWKLHVQNMTLLRAVARVAIETTASSPRPSLVTAIMAEFALFSSVFTFLHFSPIFRKESQNNGSYLRARKMLLIVIPNLSPVWQKSPGPDPDFSHILAKKFINDLAKYINMSDFAQFTPPSVFCHCAKVFWVSSLWLKWFRFLQQKALNS
jgi:hypothetical protein